MARKNQIVIEANVAKDSESRQVRDNLTVVNLFVIADNGKFNRNTNSWDDKPVAFSVDYWPKAGQTQFQKGESVLIVGKLDMDAWEDKQGARQSKLKVVAENVLSLPRKEKQGGYQQPQYQQPQFQQPQQQPQQGYQQPQFQMAPADDEIPF